MSQFGMCKFCGAEMVKSPKTGKIFCSEKCWTKNEKQEGGFSGQVARASIQADPYQKVMATKNEYIEKAQARKDEGMRILNAKNIAGDWVKIELELGLIKPEEKFTKFATYSTYIYEFEPVAKDEFDVQVENIPFN